MPLLHKRYSKMVIIPESIDGRDPVTVAAEFDPLKYSLLYSITVTDLACEAEDISVAGVTTWEFGFSRFKLFVGTAYVPVPTFPGSSATYFGTSMPRVSGIPHVEWSNEGRNITYDYCANLTAQSLENLKVRLEALYRDVAKFISVPEPLFHLCRIHSPAAGE